MTATNPAVHPDASQQAVVEAALVLLERMGLTPADLAAVPQHRLPVPTFAASDDALQEVAALAEAAEAALAPDEIEDGESPDDAARRLRADQLVVEAILEEGLDGDRHRELQDELIRYAVPVLRRLLTNGRIISKCKKLGRPASDSMAWLDFTQTDRDELARDMVADAVPVFTRAVFEAKAWSPDGTGRRASLKTYFVNACVLQFPALYRQRLSQRRAVPVGLQMDLSGVETVGDKSGEVDLNDEVMRLLRQVTDPKIREVLALRAIGYTVKEAAQRVGLTEKAAEGRVARMRRALRKKPVPQTVTGGGTPAMEDGGVR